MLTNGRNFADASFAHRLGAIGHHDLMLGIPLYSDLDTVDYAAQLEAATRTIALAGMRVLIYNHQLCTLPRSLWPFPVQSISDWKNVYLESSAGCGVRECCGGFFQSATKRHSAHIRPLPVLSQEAAQFIRGE